MSIFGKLDAATVASDPFKVDPGEYTAEVTKAFKKLNNDNAELLIIEYTIIEPESSFDGNKVSQRFQLPDADLTNEKMELLPSDEQKRIRMHLANLKRTLCGSDTNTSQKGLGVPENDLNDDDWDPKSLVGTRVTVSVKHNGNYTNVAWVNLLDA